MCDVTAMYFINLPHIKRNILRFPESRTRGCWVRSKYATSVLCSSPLEQHS